jgi:hypothetical protein
MLESISLSRDVLSAIVDFFKSIDLFVISSCRSRCCLFFDVGSFLYSVCAVCDYVGKSGAWHRIIPSLLLAERVCPTNPLVLCNPASTLYFSMRGVGGYKLKRQLSTTSTAEEDRIDRHRTE